MAEFWYNTSFHTGLGITPYEALYGVKLVPLNMGSLQDMVIPATQNLLPQRTHVLHTLKDNLVKPQQWMKYFADLNRTDRVLEVGDWVYLKLQPYKQQSIAIRTSFKLAAKFYGPFQLFQKVGIVAYKLKLPAHSKVHPVFHVYISFEETCWKGSSHCWELPEYNQEDVIVLEPLAVLQRREVIRNARLVIEWLVHWK